MLTDSADDEAWNDLGTITVATTGPQVPWAGDQIACRCQSELPRTVAPMNQRALAVFWSAAVVATACGPRSPSKQVPGVGDTDSLGLTDSVDDVTDAQSVETPVGADYISSQPDLYSSDVAVLDGNALPTCAWAGLSAEVTGTVCESGSWPSSLLEKPALEYENARFSSLHRFSSGARLNSSNFFEKDFWFIAPNGVSFCGFSGVMEGGATSFATLLTSSNLRAATVSYYAAADKPYVRHFDPAGNLLIEGTAALPVYPEPYASLRLASDGTIFLLYSGKINLVAALDTNLKLAWTNDLNPFIVDALPETIGSKPGIAVVVRNGSDVRYRHYDNQGMMTLDHALTDPLSQAYLPGVAVVAGGGQISTHIDASPLPPGLSNGAIVRFDDDGQLSWMAPVRMTSHFVEHEPWQFSVNTFGAWDAVPGRYTGDARPEGYLRSYSSHGKPSFVPVQFADAQRITPMYDGSYQVETATGYHVYNARGSGTCPGCGPPAPNCDDADPCTQDGCDPALGDCTHTRIAGCAKSLGDCITATDCDDGDPCTADTCATQTGACNHAPQKECDTGNACLGETGTCVGGACVAKPAYLCTYPLQGWAMAQETSHPQVFEGPNKTLLLAGGWVAEQVQDDGIVRWRHVLDGGIAAAARTVTAGLVVAILQPAGQAKPGLTRLVRLAANGTTVWDKTIASGLDDWWLGASTQPRRRWLVTRPDGGYVLLGHETWNGDAWQGRAVSMSADATVTLATDVTVTIPGGGPADTDRGVDGVWAAPDGGLFLAWHGQTAAKTVSYGATRLDAVGKVAWTQAFSGGTAARSAFDPWRPRGLLETSPGQVQVVTFGLAGPVLQAATVPQPQAGVKELSGYAESPGTLAVASYDQGLPAGTAWPAAVAWPGKPTFDLQPQKVFAELMQDAHFPAIDVAVTDDGRVLMLGWGLDRLPVLVRFGGDGVFQLCGRKPPSAQASPCDPPDWSFGCVCQP